MATHRNFNTVFKKTVLFVEGNPVGYTIYKEETAYTLIPTENPSAHIHPPLLRVVCNDGGLFTITGTADQSLIDQVTEDLDCLTGKQICS